MRYAWVVITLAAVVGIVLMLRGGGGSGPTPQRASSGAPSGATADPFAGSGPARTMDVAMDPGGAPVIEPKLEPQPEDHADERETEPAAAEAAADEPVEAIVSAPSEAVDAEREAGASAASEPVSPASVAPGGDGGAASLDAEALRELKTALAMEGRRLKGKGTAEDPFEITWDLLASAYDTYRPKVGKKDLPAWAEAMQGAQVRVVGYVLFPMFAAESDELLLMKNQWDGCCIGVPPTPYDAVEVKLASRSSAAGELVNYGTLRGTLRVDPYVVNDWLLSLYVLENAQLESVGLQGDVEDAGHIGPARVNGPPPAMSSPAAGSAPMGR